MVTTEKSSRPSFWLKVKKEYIIDNFNEMLDYLRVYTYDHAGSNDDFDSTLDCLLDLSDDIGSLVLSSPYYSSPELPVDHNKAIRMFAATLLAAQKKSVTPYPNRVLAYLINLILFEKVFFTEDNIRCLCNILHGCVHHYDIEFLGFTWNDIANDAKFSVDVFVHKLMNIKFRASSDSVDSNYYIEGQGLVIFPVSGNVVVSPMNRMQYLRNSVATQFAVDPLVNVNVIAEDVEHLHTFEDTYKFANKLINSLSQVVKSPEVPLKDYVSGDRFVVKIIKKNGKLIVAETCDSRYNRLSGKVYVWSHSDYRVDSDYLINYLVKDDYLQVELADYGDFTFVMTKTLEEYYRKRAADLANTEVHAIYNRDYRNGTQWITENGYRLGIDNECYNKLDDKIKDIVNEAIDGGASLRIRMYDQRPDTTKENFNMYGIPLGFSDVDKFDKSYADEQFIQSFLQFSKEIALNYENIGDSYMPADNCYGIVFGHLMSRGLEHNSASSLERLHEFVVAVMISGILRRQADFEEQLHALKYFSRIVAFAQNREVQQLSHSPLIDSLPKVRERENIVARLMDYHNPENISLTIVSPGAGKKNETTIDRISALIRASNDLRSIIGVSELNNIKQSIARSLHVGDEYKPIVDERTFYGLESISLEFKSTIVFPPSKSTPDPEYQKWNILKAICGFLNSRSGGELLIGVNDSGYAVGVQDDIKELLRLGLIKVANIDNYRLYVQNIVDRAFKECNGDMSPREIAAITVSYMAETNPEGRDILRIHVNPYPYDAVEFIMDKRPAVFADSYVRQSGRTISLTPELLTEVLKYKAQNSSSSVNEIISLREALKKHKVVILKQYESASGVKDRTVELYKVFENRRIIYGYDIDKKAPRIFKISRCEDICITEKTWNLPKCQMDIAIDIFGMILERDKSQSVEILLSNFARQILIEEIPDAMSCVKPYKGSSRGRYPYILTCDVSSIQGISRFCIGLSREVRVLKGDMLKKHLLALAHEIIDSDF